MRLALISPAPISGPLRRLKEKGERALFPKYSLMAIAALTPDDWDVSIVDERVDDVDFDQPADLVGISVLTATAPRSYEISDKFRAKGVTVVLGGIHPSVLPNEAIAHADAVVVGEAENIWSILLEDFVNGKLKKVYVSREKPTLASLPLPRRDLIDKSAYQRPDTVETSRGCPFNCEYCSIINFFGHQCRFRPVDDVVQEMEALTGDLICFVDDNIVSNFRRARELFEKLIPLHIRWMSQCTINICSDPDLLRIAAQSGCSSLIFSFDSLRRTKFGSRTKVDTEKYTEAIKIIHDQGVRINGAFIFGFDEDDESIFEETVQFIHENKIDYPGFWILTPYPGTQLFNRLTKENRITDRDWSKYDGAHVVFRPKLMDEEKLQDGFWQAYKEISSFSSILKRLSYSPRRLGTRLAFDLYIRHMTREGLPFYSF